MGGAPSFGTFESWCSSSPKHEFPPCLGSEAASDVYIYIYIYYVPIIFYVSLFPQLLLLLPFWNSRSTAEPHSRTTTEGPEYPSTEKEALYFAQVVADCSALFIAYCPHCIHCYCMLLLHVISGWEGQAHNLVIAVGIDESSHLNLSSQCVLKMAWTMQSEEWYMSSVWCQDAISLEAGSL